MYFPIFIFFYIYNLKIALWRRNKNTYFQHNNKKKTKMEILNSSSKVFLQKQAYFFFKMRKIIMIQF